MVENPKSKQTVIFIVGPTASGKSEAAFLLAKKLNGEIVSADSMQVYKFMDIATAKPPAEWTRVIPHHLIDILSPDEEFSAGKFCKMAEEAIADIIDRGKIPIVVGGTGLYIRSLLKGMFESLAADKSLREKLNEELAQRGAAHLYEKLKKLDPATAGAIDPDNPRRIIRALEVFYKLKKPILDLQVQWKGKETGIEKKYNCVLFGLRRKREDLYEGINRRVDAMFREGLLEETRHLLDDGIEKNKVAMQALGYRDVISYLRDEITIDEAKETIKRRTRNFAKRQMTWFKKEEKVEWIDVKETDTSADIAKKIAAHLDKAHLLG